MSQKKNTNNLRDQSQSKSAPHIRINNSNQKNNGKKYNNKKYYRNNNYSSPNHEQNDYYSDSGNGNSNRSPNYWNNGNFENPLYPNQPYYTPSNQYPIEPVNYMMQNMSLYEKNNFDPNNGNYSPTYYSPMGSPYDESYKPPYQGGYTNLNNYYNYENGYDSNYNYNYDYNNNQRNNYYNYEGYGNNNNNNKIKSPKNYQLEKRIGEDNKRNKNLLKILDERMQLVGQVHHAVIKDCNHQGIILDLVVYDKSGFELIADEKEDKVIYKDILKDDYNSDKEFHRYIIKSVVLDWKNLPPSISSLPIDFQIQSTYSYLPPLTTFKVYCISMDPVTNRLYIRMAKATTPVIKLPAQINTKLSFSKIQNLPSHANQGNRPRFLIIIDFEATCDFSPNPIITPDSSEIIEFPWVVLDTVTLDIVYECQLYVKPTMMEGITNYCRSLTGITEKDCENGLSLQEAINQFNNFLKTHIFPFGVDNFRIVTDSVWDLQVQLRKESIRKSIRLDWWYKDYFDLRQEFRQFYVWFPFIKRGPPLIAMLNAFGLDFVGRHHSGLDDCKSIAQIVRIMLQLHPNTFTNPKKIPENYDPEKDSSWCSFMGKCPEGAWRCSNEECLVYNKPHLTVCNFCRTIRNFNIPLETSDSNPKEEFRQLPATEIKVSTIPDPLPDHQPEVVTVEVVST